MDTTMIARIDEGLVPPESFNITAYGRALRDGRVTEAQSTSDFGFMADLTDRAVMRGYLDESYPALWESIGYRRDTKDVARADGTGQGRDYQINADRDVPKVAEGAEYLPIEPTDTYYQFRTYKHGCVWDVTWEAWLADNRDLGMLMSYPESWGRSARYTQSKVFSQAYVNNTTFFTAGRGNKTDAVLNEDSLAAGIKALRHQKDPAGNEAVYGGAITLVVGSSLEFAAKRIVNPSVNITSGVVDLKEAAMYNAATVRVDPWIEALDTTNGATSWYLFADPRIRPALRYGFVDGYADPQVFVKSSQASALRGGTTSEFDGSWNNDNISFKLRFTFGADTVDYRGAYWSDGSGS